MKILIQKEIKNESDQKEIVDWAEEEMANPNTILDGTGAGEHYAYLLNGKKFENLVDIYWFDDHGYEEGTTYLAFIIMDKEDWKNEELKEKEN